MLTRRTLLRRGAPALALLAGAGPAPALATSIRDDWPLVGLSGLPRPLAVPPYRTQLDGSRYASSNCGPATLGMVLDRYGMEVETLELRRLTHTYQGTWPGRGGTALQHIARVAADFGVPGHGLYTADDPEVFRRWSVDDLATEVARGRMAMPLVRYDYLPGHEGSGVPWGHYLLLYAREGNGFRYHDSAFRPIEAGASRWIDDRQLDRAMNPVLVPRQAVALGA